MPAQFSSHIGYDDIAADITDNIGKYKMMFLWVTFDLLQPNWHKSLRNNVHYTISDSSFFILKQRYTLDSVELVLRPKDYIEDKPSRIILKMKAD